MKEKVQKITQDPFYKMIISQNGVGENKIQELIKEIEDKKKIFLNMGGKEATDEEVLILMALTKGVSYANDNIKVSGEYKAGFNNYQEKIGELVEVENPVNNKKYIGIFLGSVPISYSLIRKDDEVEVKFGEYHGLIYLPEKDELTTTNKVFFKKLEGKKIDKFKQKLKNLFIKMKKDL